MRSPFVRGSIRRQLTLVVLAALLPMGLFAGALLYIVWDYQQVQRNREQIARVRTMALLMQRELDGSVARLQLLASDPLLDERTLAGFHARLRKVAADNPDWAEVVVVSRVRKILSSSADTAMTTGRIATLPYQRSAIDDRRPTLSDLYRAPLRDAWTIGVAVPVIRGETADLALVAGLNLTYLSGILYRIVPADGVAGLFDRNLRFVARARDPETYISRPPGDALLNAMKTQDEGILRSTTREGEPTFTAHARLEAGFTIGVATPSAPLDTALARFLVVLGSVLLATLALGLLLAQWLVGRINRTIARTVETAHRLAAGEPADFPPSSIVEFGRLSDAVTRLFRREREAREEERAANRTKDEFLAMLGHELRNPLAPIVTALHLMRLRGDEALQKERQIIERQVRHLQRLVDDLLDVARIARGAVELRRVPIELATVVAEAMEIASPLIEHKRLVSQVRVAPTGLCIDGDPARLCQVVANLLTNAAKFTDEGGRIEIVATAAAQTVMLAIRDSGHGLSGADLARIFEPFTQARQSVDRPDGGLGLGLSIARHLARLHGGDLVAASDGAGTGSTFTLTLPLSTRAPGEGPHRPGAPAITDPGTGPRVLVVDDNVDAAQALSALLGIRGFRCEIVHDGGDVLPRLRSFRADAILLDIGLPGLDGYQVARRIRADPRWRTLPLFAVTGYGQRGDEAQARAAGFDRHFVKPVDPDRLIEALHDVLAPQAPQDATAVPPDPPDPPGPGPGPRRVP